MVMGEIMRIGIAAVPWAVVAAIPLALLWIVFNVLPPKPPLEGHRPGDDGDDEFLSRRAAFRATPKKPFDVVIEYSGGSAPGMPRRITVHDVVVDGEGAIFLAAYCHVRQQPRTFRGDRIRRFSDPETGEVTEAREFLSDRVGLPLWARSIRVKLTDLRKTTKG